METIGQRIKKMRIEKQWTQKDLANRLKLKNDTAIANYEANYSIPKDEIKYKLCELLNCSMDYLMGITDIRNSIDIKDIDVSFFSGIKGLNETNKMIIKNTMDALLDKQEKDKK